eukprot:TRINITY_DN10337_c0_g1_i2.p1 TRINITY_DN10337_c0_g1~~TRINITY_DN10337_c0_g1_i2.p1  ORF type:complete len:488 (-),score=107.99 TRINITY_DN10337_c0_g1_i2:227-1690(-)
MRALSAAATLALVFAERPTQKHDEVNTEQSSEGDHLGICCLRAKGYTDENGGHKKELFVDWVSTTNPNFKPSRDCLLTSTIPNKHVYFQDQTVAMGERKVWPTVQPGHLADETCVQMMERYPLYHDEIIKQANADSQVDIKFRENANKKLDAAHNAKMYEIHENYKTKIAKEASDAGKASTDLIQAFMNDLTADANKLKNDITLSLTDLQHKDNSLAHRDRPDVDIQHANEIQAASESTARAVFQMIADHNRSLIDYVQRTASEVQNKMSEFKTTNSFLNDERLQEEVKQNNFTAMEKARLEKQAEDELEVIPKLKAAKAAKAPALSFPEETTTCTSNECCCTIMFNPGQALDVKVGTNFLNWDQCQFAGPAPLWLFRSQCSGYMTECQKCAERQECNNNKVRGCKFTAKQSVDLRPKEIEPVQPVLDEKPPPHQDSAPITPHEQLSPQKESAPVAEPVATPAAVASADLAVETVQSSPEKDSAPVA